MNTTTADARSATTTDQLAARQLRRSGDDKMLAGVAGGIARYLNADVTLVRVIIAALALSTGVGVALYIAAWLLIPADGDDQSIAAAWHWPPSWPWRCSALPCTSCSPPGCWWPPSSWWSGSSSGRAAPIGSPWPPAARAAG